MSGAPVVPEPTLPMAAHAAVRAGTTEGFSLDEVLALEDISKSLWATEEVAWKVKLASDAAALERYRSELALAEDWLDRKVTPLADDLAAWLAFLDAYAASADASALLASLDLGQNDLSRLGRRWERLAKADPQHAARIVELRKKPLALPRLRAEPRALKRSRAGGAARATQPRPPVVSNGKTADLGLDRYARICAEWEATGDIAALARFGVANEDEKRALDARFAAEIARDPTIGRDLRTLIAHIRKQARPRGDAAPTPLPPAAPPPVAPVAPMAAPSAAPAPRRRPPVATVVGAATPTAAPLPFTAAPAPAPPQPSARQSRKKNPALASTVPAADPPTAAPLPFAPKESGAPPPSSPSNRGRRRAQQLLLTLEQHASLAVELALAPKQATDILARYGLSPGQKKALDDHYRARVAASVEDRDAWNRAFEAYRAWMLRQGR
ncbi:MAG: hypothetical protein JNL21_31390 [Myxococcales bacterium]|nr:hypothetical protein [Myxococcales bacterium]